MSHLNLLLSYRGLPKSWEDYDEEELPTAARIKLRKAAMKIKEQERGGIVYVNGHPAPLLHLLKTDNLADFFGISFPRYFDSKMTKELKTMDFTPKRYTFIYGVGNESAINKKFSGQLLKNLLEQCREEKIWCFVCGSQQKTTFRQEYDLDILNSITLPTKPEQKLI